MLVALLLAVAPTASELALDIYREACVDGELKLTPERGKIVEISELPNIILNSDIQPIAREVTAIKMRTPPNTYVVIEKYGLDQKTKFELACKVASRGMAQEDVEKAFFAGMGTSKYRDNRDPGHLFEPYEIDVPNAGLRKLLYVHDDWIMIETDVYKQAQIPIHKDSQ